MARKLFAVVNTRGPNWDDTKSMEDHPGWRAHADFMNALVAEGFVLLGGPLAGTNDVLLVVCAESEAEVDARLAPDVWVANDLLRRRFIARWTLRLGSLGCP